MLVSCRKQNKIARSLFSRKVPRRCCRYFLRLIKIPTINCLLGTASQKLTKVRRRSLGSTCRQLNCFQLYLNNTVIWFRLNSFRSCFNQVTITNLEVNSLQPFVNINRFRCDPKSLFSLFDFSWYLQRLYKVVTRGQTRCVD